MRDVFICFGEDIWGPNFIRNTLNRNEVTLNWFACYIFVHLNMPKYIGGEVIAHISPSLNIIIKVLRKRHLRRRSSILCDSAISALVHFPVAYNFASVLLQAFHSFIDWEVKTKSCHFRSVCCFERKSDHRSKKFFSELNNEKTME